MGKMSRILYHYTSQDTLVKIVDSAIIRMTDCRHTNDEHEVMTVANKLIEDDQWSEEEKETLRNFFESHKIGIFSLSKAMDMLSQWDRYADAAKGVCIGFNSDHISGSQRDRYGDNLLPWGCYYTPVEIEMAFGNNFKEVYGPLNDKNIFRMFSSFIIHKNKGFKEEKEVRFYKAEPNEEAKTDEIDRPFLEMDFNDSAERFRRDFWNIVEKCPPISEAQRKQIEELTTRPVTLPIKEIIFGPKSNYEDDLKKMKEFLKSKGYPLEGRNAIEFSHYDCGYR